MPYKSEKQRRYLHAVHPDIAARWDAEYGGKVKGKKKVSKANPAKTALKFGRGTVTRSVDGDTVIRSRTGGVFLRPKTSVSTRHGGQNVARTVVGGGLTEAGKNTVAVLGAGATAGAGYAHGRHYVPRKQTKTVKVKVKKNLSAFGVEHELSKAFGMGTLGAARRMASVNTLKPTKAIGGHKEWKATQDKIRGAQTFGMKPTTPKPFGARPPGQVAPTTILPQQSKRRGLRRLNPFRGNR